MSGKNKMTPSAPFGAHTLYRMKAKPKTKKIFMNSFGAVFKENKKVKKKSKHLQEIKISSFINGFDISSPSTSGLIRINFWTSNRSHLPLGK